MQTKRDTFYFHWKIRKLRSERNIFYCRKCNTTKLSSFVIIMTVASMEFYYSASLMASKYVVGSTVICTFWSNVLPFPEKMHNEIFLRFEQCLRVFSHLITSRLWLFMQKCFAFEQNIVNILNAEKMKLQSLFNKYFCIFWRRFFLFGDKRRSRFFFQQETARDLKLFHYKTTEVLPKDLRYLIQKEVQKERIQKCKLPMGLMYNSLLCIELIYYSNFF